MTLTTVSTTVLYCDPEQTSKGVTTTRSNYYKSGDRHLGDGAADRRGKLHDGKFNCHPDWSSTLLVAIF